jgi:hypothetical protein
VTNGNRIGFGGQSLDAVRRLTASYKAEAHVFGVLARDF